MIKNFKIFESNKIENYELLASNQSTYGWDDAFGRVEAKIYLDKTDGSLYLDMKKTSGNHGINRWENTIKVADYIFIGNTTKPNLKLVKTLLAEYAYKGSRADSNFSKFWTDNEGNKMTLSDLIISFKPETLIKEPVKKDLTHIKSKNDYEKSNIELVKYSEYSYALFGADTIKIKDKLNLLGCKYNKFLTDPKTGEKRPGWIFSNKRLDDVKKII
ncbi:hypothetical protein M0Q97_08470 [Candidatus Dojkabacteria bacterium]|jgi:hypothetical protein|nr:hypothetical protein [Candidatus Dojkabacteria bacterium]